MPISKTLLLAVTCAPLAVLLSSCGGEVGATSSTLNSTEFKPPVLQSLEPSSPTSSGIVTPVVATVAAPEAVASPIQTPTTSATPQSIVNVVVPSTVQMIDGCPMFPADHILNQKIDDAPLHPNSAAYIASIGATAKLKADFGAGLYEGSPIGIPFVTVSQNQPKVPTVFEISGESDPGPYPIPPDAPVEGVVRAPDGDRHVIILDKSNCNVYEMFASQKQADNSWKAYSGAIFDLRSNALRPDTWTSADAAGLAILPSLARYEDVASGEIRRAIRFTASVTANRYIWPATHKASNRSDVGLPPMGLRVRLKADYDISGFGSQAKVILTALKRYGMVLADNGAPWFMSGIPDDRWDNTQLQSLRSIPGSAFEAVDVSSRMIDSRSAQSR